MIVYIIRIIAITFNIIMIIINIVIIMNIIIFGGTVSAGYTLVG